MGSFSGGNSFYLFLFNTLFSVLIETIENEGKEPTLTDLVAILGSQEQRFKALQHPFQLFWIQPKGKTIQEIGEIIILEQYLRMLSPELQA